MKSENTITLNQPIQLLKLDLDIENSRERSDKWADYILFIYFLAGLFFASFYDTWSIAGGVGGLALIAYCMAKFGLPDSTFYQYVFSVVLAVFMAQYIYQMHGMFEMHFTAFIGSAILITYQNWKLQIPLAVVVVAHHALFGYLQFTGQTKYFTQLENMDVTTYIIHIVLAAIIFIICGAWSHHFKTSNETQLEQTYEIAQLFKEAETQRLAVEKANSELDKFVYSVSHDLRAPLLSMQGIINITEQETKEELTREHMKMMKGGINVLDNFIAEILDYSRNIRKEVKSEKIDFHSLVDEIVNNLQYMNGSNKAVSVHVDIDTPTGAYSDKGRIIVILNNLISNSMRYYNPKISNPFVKVSIKTNMDSICIDVQDNGIGIAEEYQEKVFDMFYRVSELSTGSGLGLFIVKETLEKLEGEIHMKSTKDIGTKFTITIPNLNN